MKIRNIRFTIVMAIIAVVAGACSSTATTEPMPQPFAELMPAQPAGEVRLPANDPLVPPSEPLNVLQQRQLYVAMRQDIRDGSLERAQRRFRNAKPQLHRQPGVQAGELYADLILLSKYVDAMLARPAVPVVRQ